MLEKILYLQNPYRCILTSPCECGKSVFLKNLILNFIEHNKINIYSPSLHQDLYQKLIKYFSISIPIHIIPNILYEENIDLVFGEKVKDKKISKIRLSNRDI